MLAACTPMVALLATCGIWSLLAKAVSLLPDLLGALHGIWWRDGSSWFQWITARHLSESRTWHLRWYPWVGATLLAFYGAGRLGEVITQMLAWRLEEPQCLETSLKILEPRCCDCAASSRVCDSHSKGATHESRGPAGVEAAYKDLQSLACWCSAFWSERVPVPKKMGPATEVAMHPYVFSVDAWRTAWWCSSVPFQRWKANTRPFVVAPPSESDHAAGGCGIELVCAPSSSYSGLHQKCGWHVCLFCCTVNAASQGKWHALCDTRRAHLLDSPC